MKNSKIVAAMAAASMAVSMLSMMASAAEVEGMFEDANGDGSEWVITDFDTFFEDPEAVVVVTYTDSNDNWGDIGVGFSIDNGWKSWAATNPAGEDATVEFTVADIIENAAIEDTSSATFGKIEGYNGCVISSVVFKTPDDEPVDEPVDDVPTDAETTDAETGDDQPTDAETTDAETTDGETTDSEMLGDVSGDGRIDVSDIVRVAAYVKSLRPLNEAEAKKADANHDGKINVTDVSLIAAHVKGIRPLK